MRIAGISIRIIITEELLAGQSTPVSSGVFRFDAEFGLTDTEFVRSVSDHYPVYADFLMPPDTTDVTPAP